MKHFSVGSSHGSAIVDPDTGQILSADLELITEYDIDRFDVAELKKFRESNGMLVNFPYSDILDLGYWTHSGTYVEPDPAFRNEKYTIEDQN